MGCSGLMASGLKGLVRRLGLSYSKMISVGYCPHPVTVYIRGPIKGYI